MAHCQAVRDHKLDKALKKEPLGRNIQSCRFILLLPGKEKVKVYNIR